MTREVELLRRAENVRVDFKAGVFSSRGSMTVTVGATVWRTVKMSSEQYRQLTESQRRHPVCILCVNERNYWYFQDRFHWENEGLQADQVHALLVTKQQRQQGRIERAQAMVAMGGLPQPRGTRRDIIPDDVKQFVFMRDGGRCRHCSSQVELQFDHIIPVAMGGGSSPENLQVLCGPCNRRKSAGLTVR